MIAPTSLFTICLLTLLILPYKVKTFKGACVGRNFFLAERNNQSTLYVKETSYLKTRSTINYDKFNVLHTKFLLLRTNFEHKHYLFFKCKLHINFRLLYGGNETMNSFLYYCQKKKCSFCNRIFFHKYNYRYHYFTYHFMSM